MEGRATYQSEEITAEFSARGTRADYGVSGSPVWIDWTDEDITELTILGVKVDPKALPDELWRAIHSLAEYLEFERTD